MRPVKTPTLWRSARSLYGSLQDHRAGGDVTGARRGREACRFKPAQSVPVRRRRNDGLNEWDGLRSCCGSSRQSAKCIRSIRFAVCRAYICAKGVGVSKRTRTPAGDLLFAFRGSGSNREGAKPSGLVSERDARGNLKVGCLLPCARFSAEHVLLFVRTSLGGADRAAWWRGRLRHLERRADRWRSSLAYAPGCRLLSAECSPICARRLWQASRILARSGNGKPRVKRQHEAGGGVCGV